MQNENSLMGIVYDSIYCVKSYVIILLGWINDLVLHLLYVVFCNFC